MQVSVAIRCADCLVPQYSSVVPDKWYTLVVPSFLVEGGDNFLSISEHYRNRTIGE